MSDSTKKDSETNPNPPQFSYTPTTNWEEHLIAIIQWALYSLAELRRREKDGWWEIQAFAQELVREIAKEGLYEMFDVPDFK